MSEPNFSIDFTARMLATLPCERGHLLVFDAAYVRPDGIVGVWFVSTAANRVTANARTQAVALTRYGGSAVGKVSYQAAGTVAAEISGLSDGYPSRVLVRASSTGTFERISSYTTGDDVVGFAEPDGRVHLHLGLPWQDILAAAGGEANTASNVGSGADIFKQKTGVDLEFRGVLGIGAISTAVNGDNIEASFSPGGTDTQAYYNNAGALATTDQITISGSRAHLVSPIVTGTPVYRVTNLDIPSYVTKVATVATTQVNCGTVAIADETTAAVEVIVRCSRDTSNTKRGVYKFSAVVSRNGGAAVLDDLVTHTPFNLNGGTVTCDVNSNDFRVRITPADTDARKWDSEIRVQVNT